MKEFIFIPFIAILASCSSQKADVLDDLGQAVLKSKEELVIDIKAVKEDKTPGR